MSTARRDDHTVQSVTTAPRKAADDLNARMKHYLVTMGIRTACFVLAFLTSGWVRWTCVALAVVLPYIAVVFANARSPRAAGRLAPGAPRDPHQRQLDS
ncbi:DUF3099 domain-containing protein [Knoellia locipacati]|uniref:DUF3099 domain-containing protein n=1 Tax=Knoellia locipacati TaxID=882824 RepID=UPI00384F85CD